VDFVKVRKEFKWWLDEPLFAREETFKTTQVTSMLGAYDHKIVIVDYLFEGHASFVNDGVIFTVLNHSWYLYILNKGFTRIILLIWLKVRFIIYLPIYFVFKLMNTFQVCNKSMKVNSVFLLIYRCKVIYISSKNCFIPLCQAPVYETKPCLFDILKGPGYINRRLYAGSSWDFTV